jgi:pteridine reductase
MPDATQPVALVTGGAQRVGKAIVQKLAQAGFDIAFTFHHSAAEADELRRSLESIPRRVISIQADLTTIGSAVDRIGREIDKQFNRLDVLVNSASIYQPTPLDKPLSDADAQMFAIHYYAPLELSRRLAPLLRANRGHIVNMVDVLAERPWPEYLSYCASKAALANLTLALARQLAPDVTVNGIAPGAVAWPEAYPHERRENYLKRVPLARPGAPEDVANLVHFLVTDGSYITGQIIRLDGGRSIT